MVSSFQDRDLTCVECNQTFVFTADDQQYHSDKGYTNEPKRCPSCRQARRANRGFDGGAGGGGGGGGGFGGMRREMHPAVCAECGKDTEVAAPKSRSGPRESGLYIAMIAIGSKTQGTAAAAVGHTDTSL